ncbi:MAG: biotin transporter BioY [Chloroflexota bacterium]
MHSLVRSLPLARSVHGQFILAAGFACLTALGALVYVPIGPVPITLQVLFVILSGLLLGSRLGALSQMQYLALGLAGAPVFAQGKFGLLALLGPTGGYLVGCVAMAYVVGLVAESTATPGRVRLFLAGLIGIPTLYIFGATWLSIWFAMANGTSWIAQLDNAWQFGVLPFILPDIGKALVASGVALSGRALLGLLKQ